MSKEEGSSNNASVASAIAKKVSALKTAEFFAERRARADIRAFDRILNRKRGETPRKDDEF